MLSFTPLCTWDLLPSVKFVRTQFPNVPVQKSAIMCSKIVVVDSWWLNCTEQVPRYCYQLQSTFRQCEVHLNWNHFFSVLVVELLRLSVSHDNIFYLQYHHVTFGAQCQSVYACVYYTYTYIIFGGKCRNC